MRAAGCGRKALFGVSTEEDNVITVTADRGVKNSAGLGYLSVGEGEEVVIETSFEKSGRILCSFRAGLLGSDSFSDEPTAELTVGGEDSVRLSIAPGEYTVMVKALDKLTGSARLSMQEAGA